MALVGTIAIVLLLSAAWLFRAQLAAFLGVNVDAGPGGAAELELPDGFTADVFAEGLANPRFMAVSPEGVLFVAERGVDRVVALPDADGDGTADEIVEVGAGYGRAHDVEFTDDGRLLVAGESTLHEVALDGLAEAGRRVVVEGLPTGGNHTTRTVGVLPSGEILLSIGSSCNVCDEEDERRATVQLVTDDGMRPFMVGLRNAVGLWVDPDTGRAWATNMGRDLLGDHEPPETLYELVDGADAGWPRCHAAALPDPEFGTDATACDGVAAPAATFPAHTAPLALVGWDDHLVVALHGSWNSSVKVGYALWWIPWDGAPAGDPEPFATGFLPEGASDALGRPAGLAVGADGALYASDDKAGFIYRIARTGG
ncbi:MAG TPA: sorbosone dehydrogenase family protein [Candidatus Limnocylindria bacterium]|nr:sorbosone dehydrogenase family protein [Candidatus Limnocylindria bacterium]